MTKSKSMKTKKLAEIKKVFFLLSILKAFWWIFEGVNFHEIRSARQHQIVRFNWPSCEDCAMAHWKTAEWCTCRITLFNPARIALALAAFLDAPRTDLIIWQLRGLVERVLLVEELLAIDLRAVEVVHHQRVLHFEVNTPHELFDLTHDVNLEF
jgi:hypothetical protein